MKPFRLAFAVVCLLGFVSSLILAFIAAHRENYAEACWHLLLTAAFYWQSQRMGKES